MSAAVTAAGEVWTFGGGFNGELGTGASWSPGARRVEGILAQVWCAHLLALGGVPAWGGNHLERAVGRH